MVLINIIEYMAQITMIQWIFGAFAFFGIMLCIKKLIWGGNE